eukprot:365362-Chlamydomonas_euryale.AAC.11
MEFRICRWHFRTEAGCAGSSPAERKRHLSRNIPAPQYPRTAISPRRALRVLLLQAGRAAAFWMQHGAAQWRRQSTCRGRQSGPGFLQAVEDDRLCDGSSFGSSSAADNSAAES